MSTLHPSARVAHQQVSFPRNPREERGPSLSASTSTHRAFLHLKTTTFNAETTTKMEANYSKFLDIAKEMKATRAARIALQAPQSN